MRFSLKYSRKRILFKKVEKSMILLFNREKHFCKIVRNFMTELPEDICPYEKKLEEMGRRAQIHPYTMLFLLENTLRLREIFQNRGFILKKETL